MITESSIRKIEPDIYVIDISGRLHLGNTLLSLESSILQLIGNGARRLIVNLTDLNYIDSAGVGMLISCNGQMDRNHGMMRIAGAHGAVATAFETIHIERVVALDPDVDSASAAFSNYNAEK